MNAIYEGLGIMLKYSDTLDTYAEHDVFYAGFDNDWEVISSEDKKELEMHGWIESDDSGYQIFT